MKRLNLEIEFRAEPIDLNKKAFKKKEVIVGSIRKKKVLYKY